jgi:methyltransferase family protein
MNTAADLTENRDISVYDSIPSQTSEADRRAMLGVQAAYQRKFGTFVYLEIGSHLGGSLQPCVLNSRCTRIYSVDKRPEAAPDDRIAGGSSGYPDNSTQRMLKLLSGLSVEGAKKIATFDSDASEIDTEAISEPPTIAFIDAEHTARAVKSDFDFCVKVLAPGGAIVFHDYRVLRDAIANNVASLQERDFVAFRIEGDIYGVIFDPDLVRNDPYLNSRLIRHERMKNYYSLEWAWWKMRDFLLVSKHLMASEGRDLW